MTVKKIEVTRSVADLLDQAEKATDHDTPNEDATVERWGDLLRAELRDQFPDAEVEIRTRRAPTAGLEAAVRADDPDEERAARETVTRIGERLAEGDDWIIPEVGG